MDGKEGGGGVGQGRRHHEKLLPTPLKANAGDGKVDGSNSGGGSERAARWENGERLPSWMPLKGGAGENRRAGSRVFFNKMVGPTSSEANPNLCPC